MYVRFHVTTLNDSHLMTLMFSICILKRKRFATIIQCKLLLQILTEIFLSVILRLTSPVLCLAYNMLLRTAWLTVAEKTSKLRGNQCFKSHDTLYCMRKCLFSKAKRTEMQIWKFDEPVKQMISFFFFFFLQIYVMLVHQRTCILIMIS